MYVCMYVGATVHRCSGHGAITPRFAKASKWFEPRLHSGRYCYHHSSNSCASRCHEGEATRTTAETQQQSCSFSCLGLFFLKHSGTKVFSYLKYHPLWKESLHFYIVILDVDQQQRYRRDQKENSMYNLVPYSLERICLYSNILTESKQIACTRIFCEDVTIQSMMVWICVL